MGIPIDDNEVRRLVTLIGEHGRKRAGELMGLTLHQVTKRLQRAQQLGIFTPNPNLVRWQPGQNARPAFTVQVGDYVEHRDVAGPVERIEGERVWFRCELTGRLVEAHKEKVVQLPSPADLERIHGERRQQLRGMSDDNARRSRVYRQPKQVARNLTRRGTNNYLS